MIVLVRFTASLEYLELEGGFHRVLGVRDLQVVNLDVTSTKFDRLGESWTT